MRIETSPRVTNIMQKTLALTLVLLRKKRSELPEQFDPVDSEQNVTELS